MANAPTDGQMSSEPDQQSTPDLSEAGAAPPADPAPPAVPPPGPPPQPRVLEHEEEVWESEGGWFPRDHD